MILNYNYGDTFLKVDNVRRTYTHSKGSYYKRRETVSQNDMYEIKKQVIYNGYKAI